MQHWVSRFLVGVLLIAATGLTYADYASGLNAYAAGEYRKAFKEWLRSAERGHMEAQYRLAKLYEDGEGVSHNPTKAYIYYQLAGNRGHPEAYAGRERVADQLSRTQREMAKEEAELWEPVGTPEPVNTAAPTPPKKKKEPPRVPPVEQPVPEPQPPEENKIVFDPMVRRAQILLDELGYRPGPIDGLPGGRTTRAVRSFQNNKGLRGTGEVSVDLVAKLETAVRQKRRQDEERLVREAEELKRKQPVQYWGAVSSFKESSGETRFWFAWLHEGSSAAENAALDACRSNVGNTCELQTQFGNCFALAFSDGGGWGWATRGSIAEARQTSLDQCHESNESCSLNFSVCADGTGHYQP